MGDVVAAVDRYTDIPADARQRLKNRMARRDYDDIADIRRDSLRGRFDYEPAIRDMHFGTGRVCTSVSRGAWSDAQQERGLVYCDGAQCIIVPTVCRNVSRVTRRAPPAVAAADTPSDELLFAPPGAGPADEAVGDAAAPDAAPLSFNEGAGVPLIAGPGPGGGGIIGGGGGGGGDDGGAGPDLPGPGPYVPPIVIPGGPDTPSFPTLPPAVPEPATLWLMVAGLLVCITLARRTRRASPV